MIHIQTEDGAELTTFAPEKVFQSIVFSSLALEDGAAVEIFYGGSSTGTANHGLYPDGTYTPGDDIASFIVANVVTTIGNSYR